MSLRFATALFVSAMLLFTCQPLVARMIVPLLGGFKPVALKDGSLAIGAGEANGVALVFG